MSSYSTVFASPASDEDMSNKWQRYNEAAAAFCRAYEAKHPKFAQAGTFNFSRSIPSDEDTSNKWQGFNEAAAAFCHAYEAKHPKFAQAVKQRREAAL